MWQDKNIKKEYSDKENYWKDLQQENYLGNWIKDITKNIGEG